MDCNVIELLHESVAMGNKRDMDHGPPNSNPREMCCKIFRKIYLEIAKWILMQ